MKINCLSSSTCGLVSVIETKMKPQTKVFAIIGAILLIMITALGIMYIFGLKDENKEEYERIAVTEEVDHTTKIEPVDPIPSPEPISLLEPEPESIENADILKEKDDLGNKNSPINIKELFDIGDDEESMELEDQPFSNGHFDFSRLTFEFESNTCSPISVNSSSEDDVISKAKNLIEKVPSNESLQSVKSDKSNESFVRL